MAEEFKPKLTGEEFVVKLKEAGFTEKTIDALQEEDINSDTALKILSERDIETLADEKKLTIGQKRLLVEFSATLKPKRESDRYAGEMTVRSGIARAFLAGLCVESDLFLFSFCPRRNNSTRMGVVVVNFFTMG